MMVSSCVYIVVLLGNPVLGYGESEARAAVEDAEGKVLSCYEAVFEAEKAGANVFDYHGRSVGLRLNMTVF